MIAKRFFGDHGRGFPRGKAAFIEAAKILT
jgi:hypothetical protein